MRKLLNKSGKEGSLASNGSGSSLLGFALSLPPLLLVLGFVGIPILIGFTFSLGFTKGPNRIISIIGQQIHPKTHWWGTLAAYSDVFHDSRFVGDLVLTLAVTAISTVLVILIALAIALHQRLVGGRTASVLATLSIVPLFVPVVISAWAIHTFYGGDGFMRSFFANIGINFPTLTSTSTAIVIGSVWTSLPFSILMISSGVQAVPDALIESAKDCGASTLKVITTVVVPLAQTPFTSPLFLGPNQPTMLGVEISNFFGSYNRPQQSLVMAFIVFLAASGIAVLYIWSNVKSAKENGRI